jgi:hypothetical protein
VWDGNASLLCGHSSWRDAPRGNVLVARGAVTMEKGVLSMSNDKAVTGLRVGKKRQPTNTMGIVQSGPPKNRKTKGEQNTLQSSLPH